VVYGANDAGNIRYQLGNVLLATTEAIKDGRIEQYADLIRHLITISAPKLSKPEREAFRKMILPAQEEYARAKREKDKDGLRSMLFEACEIMQEDLLEMLSGRGIYAWKESETKDATDDLRLKDAPVDDDDALELRA
jgi:hypothetical protein